MALTKEVEDTPIMEVNGTHSVPVRMNRTSIRRRSGLDDTSMCILIGGFNTKDQKGISRNSITDSITDSVARDSKNNGMFAYNDPGSGELHPEPRAVKRFIVPPTPNTAPVHHQPAVSETGALFI